MRSRLSLLLVLLLPLAAWTAALAPAGAAGNVLVQVSVPGGSGIRVYHAKNAGGFGFVGFRVDGTATGDYQPWHMQWVLPNGTIMPFVPTYASETDDGSRWGLGDGVAYAGTGDAEVVSPAVLVDDTALVWDWGALLAGTEGWLVLAWAGHTQPLDLEVALPPGTVVAPVASSGDVAAYESKDFEGGVRAAVPAVALANLDDALAFAADGGQLWGYVVYLKSTALGRGALTLAREGDGFVRQESFDATPEFAPGEGLCICAAWGRWLFTSSSDVRVDLDYVGDGRRTAVYVVLGRLPAGTLPADLWTELSGRPNVPVG